MGFSLPVVGSIVGALGGAAAHKKKVPVPVSEPGILADLGSLTYDQWLASLPKMQRKTAKKMMTPTQWAEWQNRNALVRQVTDYYKQILSNPHLYSTEEMRNMVGPQIARSAADAQGANRALMERSIAMGLGPRSGVVERGMENIARAQLGANRQTWSELIAELARLRPQMQMAAGGGLTNISLADAAMTQAQNKDWYQAALTRSQQPSMFQDILGGAVAGFLGTSNPAQRGATPTMLPNRNYNFQLPGGTNPFLGITQADREASQLGSFQLPKPTTELKLGSGYSPISQKFLAAGNWS